MLIIWQLNKATLTCQCWFSCRCKMQRIFTNSQKWQKMASRWSGLHAWKIIQELPAQLYTWMQNTVKICTTQRDNRFTAKTRLINSLAKVWNFPGWDWVIEVTNPNSIPILCHPEPWPTTPHYHLILYMFIFFTKELYKTLSYIFCAWSGILKISVCLLLKLLPIH